MQKEIDTLENNNTWIICKLPPGQRAISCRWTYKVKRDGTRKSILVARGFEQRAGIDYTETFSSTTRLNSIRLMLSIAINVPYAVVKHLDITSAFTEAELEDETYMLQAPGFTAPGKENCVYKLKKAIYGLAVSSRLFNRLLTKLLLQINVKATKSDPSFFYLREGDDWLIMPVYVDDMYPCFNNVRLFNKVFNHLKTKLQVKDLGRLRDCLGFEIKYTPSTIIIDHSKVIQACLKRFNMIDSKPCPTPESVGNQLKHSDSPATSSQTKEMESIPYREAVGTLTWIMLVSRPDIAASLCKVSQFNCNPGLKHRQAVKHIFRYLNGTIDKKLTFTKNNINNRGITGYVDSSHADIIETRKSTSGFIIFFLNNPISWATKVQRIVAHSSTEAEYIAIDDIAKDIVWTQTLIQELGFNHLIPTPITIHEDNQGAIALSKNPVNHSRSKHIDIRYHFIRDLVEEGTVILKYINTNSQLADIFTNLNLCLALNFNHYAIPYST